MESVYKSDSSDLDAPYWDDNHKRIAKTMKNKAKGKATTKDTRDRDPDACNRSEKQKRICGMCAFRSTDLSGFFVPNVYVYNSVTITVIC